MSVKKILAAGWMLALLILAVPAPADVVQLKADHPERYVVQKGDTLWDISKRFLADPWRWASVWKINDQIKNPHLIYPGDVILLTWVDGKPQLSVQREEKLPTAAAPAPVEPEAAPAPAPEEPAVREPALAESPRAIEEPAGTTPSGMKIVKLRPRTYVSPIKDAIPTISPDVILPFLNEPKVVQRDELERAGYVMYGYDDRVALGAGPGTVPTRLPACDLSTRQPLAPGRELLDAGVQLALASNCNPGTSYTSSMAFCVTTAVLQMRLSVHEAVRAATYGGALALGRESGNDVDGERAVGSIAVGHRADLHLLNAPSATHLAYRPGIPLTHAVWRAGVRAR